MAEGISLKGVLVLPGSKVYCKPKTGSRKKSRFIVRFLGIFWDRKSRRDKAVLLHPHDYSRIVRNLEDVEPITERPRRHRRRRKRPRR